MNTLPCAPSCCSPTQVVNVPGIAGDDGLPGTNGIDAFTTLTGPPGGITVPPAGGQVGVQVLNSSWMVPGQYVIVTGPATFIVAAVPTTTTATLQFVRAYGDVVPGTVIGAGATVSPAGVPGGGWVTLNVKQDQAVINSTTVVASIDMQFSMLANTNYRIRGAIFFDTTAAGEFKYDFFAPAAPTLVRFYRLDNVNGSAVGSAPVGRAPDTATPGTTSATAGGTTGGYISFDAIFQNGPNANLFQFQFAQQSAQNDTGAIVRAGSYIEYSVVA